MLRSDVHDVPPTTPPALPGRGRHHRQSRYSNCVTVPSSPKCSGDLATRRLERTSARECPSTSTILIATGVGGSIVVHACEARLEDQHSGRLGADGRGVSNGPNDPSRSGKAPVVVNGRTHLGLELVPSGAGRLLSRASVRLPSLSGLPLWSLSSAGPRSIEFAGSSSRSSHLLPVHRHRRCRLGSGCSRCQQSSDARRAAARKLPPGIG